MEGVRRVGKAKLVTAGRAFVEMGIGRFASAIRNAFIRSASVLPLCPNCRVKTDSGPRIQS